MSSPLVIVSVVLPVTAPPTMAFTVVGLVRVTVVLSEALLRSLAPSVRPASPAHPSNRCALRLGASVANVRRRAVLVYNLSPGRDS